LGLRIHDPGSRVQGLQGEALINYDLLFRVQGLRDYGMKDFKI
jgi:hypothetical protein